MSNSVNGGYWLNMQSPRGSPASPMVSYAAAYPRQHPAVRMEHITNQPSPQMSWHMANSLISFGSRGSSISPLSNQYNIPTRIGVHENVFGAGAGADILQHIKKNSDSSSGSPSGKRIKQEGGVEKPLPITQESSTGYQSTSVVHPLLNKVRQLDGGNISGLKRQRLSNTNSVTDADLLGSPGQTVEMTGNSKLVFVNADVIHHSVLMRGQYSPKVQITAAMLDYFTKNHQADEVYRKKMKLRDALYGILQGVFPYCGLYAVGSSMSGFGTNKSDMDLCLMLTREQIDQKCEATEILNLVHRGLKKCSFIKTSQVIKAKVPILKFWDDISNVECDLNVNNSVGIRNTHLLKAYARMDWRVRPLVLFIKYWSRFHDINDARKQTISSYSFGLMAIHYLQYGCAPAVLPSLQKLYPDIFNIKNDIISLRLDEELPPYESKNNESLGDLFLGFLKYYSTDFDFKRSVVSVRTGNKLPLEVVKLKVSTPGQWKCLSIEEPFDMSNTARAVFDEETFNRIYRVFQTSYKRLNKRKDVSDILSRPL